jgi:hypothetical protein
MHVVIPDLNKVFKPFKDEISKVREVTIEHSALTSFDFFQIRLGREIVADFKLSELPGCCGVCVSFFAHVFPDFRGKGIGTMLNRLRIAIAKEAKYGLLICTDVDNNIPQNKILAKNGWELAANFINPKTKHCVNLHYIKL